MKTRPKIELTAEEYILKLNLENDRLKTQKKFTQQNECDNCKDAENCKNCNSYYESCIGYEEDTKD